MTSLAHWLRDVVDALADASRRLHHHRQTHIDDPATVTVPSPTFGSETATHPSCSSTPPEDPQRLHRRGSTVVGAVARLLDDVAAALDPTARTTYDGRHSILRENGEIEHSHPPR